MKRALFLIPAMLLAAGVAHAATPGTDARGYTVVSAPATAPAGANLPFDRAANAPIAFDVGAERAVFAPRPATASYPACTQAVTDHCSESYVTRAQ